MGVQTGTDFWKEMWQNSAHQRYKDLTTSDSNQGYVLQRVLRSIRDHVQGCLLWK